MTRAAVVHTDVQDSAEAGARLAADISAQLGGARPDAVILFASARYAFPGLLRAIQNAGRPGTLVGSSSAGAFTGVANGTGMACAVALRAPDMLFTGAAGRGLRGDARAAARQLTRGFRGAAHPAYAHRAALV